MAILNKLLRRKTGSWVDDSVVKMRQELDTQRKNDDMIIARLNSAQTTQEYEKAVSDAVDAGLNIGSHKIRLAQRYIKDGMNDKAWRYLNGLVSSDASLLARIRWEQHRILKKEGKWEEALRFLAFCYVDKPTYSNSSFVKDATPIGNKLKLPSGSLEALAESLADAHRSERLADTAFKQFREQYIGEQ